MSSGTDNVNNPHPSQPTAEVVTTLVSTPGHTIGPFFHNAFHWANVDGAAAAGVDGTGHLRIEGTVVDGAGEPIPAWLVEAWVPQAVEAETAAGMPAPGFRRLPNAPDGRFVFHVPRPAPGQPAAFVTLFGLGLTRHFCTAVFVGSDGDLLDAVPEARRQTLIARPLGDDRYEWTIRTQGEAETVFFDYR